MFILADRELDAVALRGPGLSAGAGDQIEIRVGSTIAAAEQQLIHATMARFLDNKNQVAKVLGISLKTLYVRLNLYAACSSARG
jgi:DNA-binding NtrC family response regulator